MAHLRVIPRRVGAEIQFTRKESQAMCPPPLDQGERDGLALLVRGGARALALSIQVVAHVCAALGCHHDPTF